MVDVPQPENSDQLRWPSCLYGDSTTVKARWTVAFQQALQLGDWGPVLAAGSRPVETLPGQIVLDDDLGLSQRRELHWRLNWVTHPFMFYDCEGRYPTQPDPYHRRLFLAGLQYSWFTVATLGNPSGLGFASWLVTPNDDVALRVLDRFVHCLPLFEALSPRMVGDSGAGGHIPRSSKFCEDDQLWWLLWNPFLGLFLPSNLLGDPSQWQEELKVRPDKDIIAWLVEKGVISEADDGFHLRCLQEGEGGHRQHQPEVGGTPAPALQASHAGAVSKIEVETPCPQYSQWSEPKVYLNDLGCSFNPINLLAIRTDQAETVFRVLSSVLSGCDVFVSLPQQGWVLLFDADLSSRCSERYELMHNPLPRFAEFAAILCRACECPALGVSTYSHEGNLSWWLFSSSGRLRARFDEVHSHPLERPRAVQRLLQLLADDFDIPSSPEVVSSLSQALEAGGEDLLLRASLIAAFLGNLGILSPGVDYARLFRSLGGWGPHRSETAITFLHSPSSISVSYAGREGG